MKVGHAGARPGFVLRVCGALFALVVLSQVRAATGGEPFIIAKDAAVSAFHPSVTVDHDKGFVVAWISPEVMVRRYLADGTPAGDAVQANLTSVQADFGAQPKIVGTGEGDYLVVWQTYRADLDRMDLLARRLDGEGVPYGDELAISSGDDTRHEDVAAALAADGSFVAAWWAYTPGGVASVRFQRFDTSGERTGSEHVLAPQGSARSMQPDVALSADGTAYVVWYSLYGGGVQLARIDGSDYVSQMNVAETGHTPRIAMTRAGPLVAWRDPPFAYAMQFGADGTPGERITLNASSEVSHTANVEDRNGYALDLAAEPDAGWIAAWQAERPGGGHHIFARRYSAYSAPDGEEFQVNSPEIGARHPAAAIDRAGGLVMAWTATGDNEPWSVFGRQYAPRPIGVTELGVEAEDSSGGHPVHWGHPAVYYVQVRNHHDAPAEPGFAVDITISGAGTLESVGAEHWFCEGTGPIHCTYDDWLAPGLGAYWLPVVVRAPQGSTETSAWNRIDVELTSRDTDLDLTNNTSFAQSTITDTSPDPFSFTTLSNVEPNTVQTSNAVTITGIGVGVPIRVENGGEYSVDGGPFTSAPSSIDNGAVVQLRHVSATRRGESRYNTLIVGLGQASFLTKNVPADAEPDPFHFTDQQDVPVDTVVTSGAVTVTGIDSNVSLWVKVAGGAYSVDGRPFTTSPGAVVLGSSVRVQHRSSAQPATTVATTLTIGEVSDVFTSTTKPADTTPDPFAFADVSGVERDASVTSDAVVVSGIERPALVSVTGGSYSIDNGAFVTASGTVNAGQSVRVRHTSSASFLTSVSTMLTIGGVSDTFTSTTEARDTVPDGFAFQDQSGVERSTTITSTEVTVTGINDPAPISVDKGKYSIDGGVFTNRPGTVNNGQRVRVRHNASSEFSTTKTTTLVIGGVSGAFTSTTEARDAAPDGFSFIDRPGALPLATVTSNTIVVSGINDVIPIAIQVDSAGLASPEAAYSINGGAFTATPGRVALGDTVTLRVRAPLEPGTTVRLSVTIGEGGDRWDVTTAP